MLRDENWYKENYLNKFPNDFLSWVEGFIVQIDVPYPDTCSDIYEMQRRIGAWETQSLITKKLKYAVSAERERIEKMTKTHEEISQEISEFLIKENLTTGEVEFVYVPSDTYITYKTGRGKVGLPTTWYGIPVLENKTSGIYFITKHWDEE